MKHVNVGGGEGISFSDENDGFVTSEEDWFLDEKKGV